MPIISYVEYIITYIGANGKKKHSGHHARMETFLNEVQDAVKMLPTEAAGCRIELSCEFSPDPAPNLPELPDQAPASSPEGE